MRVVGQDGGGAEVDDVDDNDKGSSGGEVIFAEFLLAAWKARAVTWGGFCCCWCWCCWSFGAARDWWVRRRRGARRG